MFIEVRCFPSPFQDWLHFGQISLETGNAFACSNEYGWKTDNRRTPTDLSVNKAVLRHDQMTNRDGHRDPIDVANKILINIPVHMMYIKGIPDNMITQISIGVNVGGETFWSATHDLVIRSNREAPEITTIQDVVLKDTVSKI